MLSVGKVEDHIGGGEPGTGQTKPTTQKEKNTKAKPIPKHGPWLDSALPRETPPSYERKPKAKQEGDFSRGSTRAHLNPFNRIVVLLYYRK
jgi:hypothetical protein